MKEGHPERERGLEGEGLDEVRLKVRIDLERGVRQRNGRGEEEGKGERAKAFWEQRVTSATGSNS